MTIQKLKKGTSPYRPIIKFLNSWLCMALSNNETAQKLMPHTASFISSRISELGWLCHYRSLENRWNKIIKLQKQYDERLASKKSIDASELFFEIEELARDLIDEFIDLHNSLLSKQLPPISKEARLIAIWVEEDIGDEKIAKKAGTTRQYAHQILAEPRRIMKEYGKQGLSHGSKDGETGDMEVFPD